MENYNKETQYMIPVNVNSSFEFFPNYGWKQLIITIIGFTLGYLVQYIINIFLGFIEISTSSKLVIRTLIISVITAIAIFGSIPVSRKGLSPFEFLIKLNKFNKKQRVFYYVYGSGGKIFDQTKR
jgi:hypothetical protein